MLGSAAVLVGCLVSVPVSAADDSRSELDRIERELDAERARQRDLETRSVSLGGEIAALRASVIETAAAVQRREAELATIEADLARLAQIYQQRRRAMDRNRFALSTTLAALVRLARRPPEAIAVMPSATARGIAVLQTVMPALDGEARSIADDLEALSAPRRAQDERRAAFAAVKEELVGERERLEALVARKSRVQAQVEVDRRGTSRQVAALAADAANLRDLIRALAGGARGEATPALSPRLAAVPLVPRERRPPRKPQASSLPLPAFGDFVQGFGQPLDDGTASLGMTIRTGSGAQIIAPHDGRVVFAGLFRSYGQLLIIEHGERYHILLAGFARIDSRVGEQVRAGEPVGVMDSGATPRPILYVEVRHDGRPIDPRVWLESGTRKVSG
ncbi:MAG: peptidoglycan DD-metalloendopeptidase family protein [Alphaproteobacteria bacterium]|nr:peptidoglycan DD-metalloendopeptidase family protein [Alphaproteobacteria bacterium]MDP6517663.1 peptidoglycan DD-metalloendopeptidase family protein [Alphaproteobacteria bacterium]